MTLKQVAWFITAYLGLVAVTIWFNLAVLCQGDPKYSGGCAGFEVYIPLWEIFLSPLPLAAIVIELWRRAQPPPMARLVAYLAGIIAVGEIGFLFIEKFPVLLALEAAVIALALIIRWRAKRSSSNAAPVA